MKPFIPLFRFLIRRGDLTVVDVDSIRHRFGDGTGKPVVMRLRDRTLHERLAFKPSLALGEGYMDGTLFPAEGTTLLELLTLLIENEAATSSLPPMNIVTAVARIIGRWQTYNP